jgi:formylglycine-generating enzyme required for sulfatase activity
VEGKAMQMIRSWFTAMPGEHLSCVGCHEVQNTTTPVKRTQASPGKPAVPKPWYGPKRGFAFSREVQPVLDRYCAGCHDGQKAKPNLADVKVMKTSMGNFPASYVELHPYVRRNGPEGVYYILTPLEFHADTSELVQMLNKGHHNVKLDPESWDRLVTWIDLNVPAYGTWNETRQIPGDFAKRRYEMRKEYGMVDEDIEAIPEAPKPVAFQQPAPLAPRPAAVAVPGWPMTAEQAQAAQKALGQTDLKLDLGDAGSIELKRIPAGTFAMGDVNGEMDEFPMAKVTIAKPFWMGATEISLQQYRAFKAEHNNGYYDMHYKDQVRPGYPMDTPEFPVIRVSWDDAMAFCQWLSKKTGKKITLPTEAQWEWACRAGSATPFWYGDRDADFSKNANVADKQISKLAVVGVDPKPKPNPDRFWDYVPKDGRFDDGFLHLAPVTQYEANPWGLKNMHGNVFEWTADAYRPYPYQAAAPSAGGKKTVRGGSWERRPTSARASFRLPYPSWQRVSDVGFRVIVED